MGFWIAAGAISLFVAFLILMAFLRPRREAVPAAAYDLQVYRDQLKEVDRDLERGILTEGEAARARTEVSRRILEADRALQIAEATQARRAGADRWIVTAGLVAVLAGTVFVYMRIGQPGYPDVPLQTRISLVEEARANRPPQEQAEAEVTMRPAIPDQPEREALVAELRTIMENRPNDPEGMALLASNEAALGNFRAARLAQQRLIEILGEEATGNHYIDLAEMMILSAGGYVSPEAEAALTEGLALEPRNGTARYYAGLMYAQQGRPDLAFPIWRNLMAESTPDAPWLEPIRLQIEEVAVLAGHRVTLADLPQPSAPRGPSAADVEAAQEMAPEDRAAMVEGMVAGLADRLATEGGPPEDWARLITAYGVLGQADAAQAIYEEALTVFADAPDALALIEEAGARLPGAAQ
ncbi:c-type cytochrome biogenesis protein CcmI [Roseibacterium sp. SDUM158016]|uniref:c-type cytochrome biogenesis protein CcmI n=1 Tax=Roseicyclus sediminis TaxID=2980997 RepID=UPI0021CFA142|nr:c-type cytochrome biogenesis protein CcmI [Roseibacterium sp. SDUM158016]MCU4651830.1 c-type cytochrome biogenesis protein CcmI [Roseibacterium sp. SDUM158016]